MKPEMLYVATAILGWGVGCFLLKYASAIHPAMLFTIGLLSYMLIAAVIWLTMKFDYSMTLVGAIFAIISYILMSLGTLGFAYLIRSGSEVGRAIILTSLYPALTLILSMIFLGETLTVIRGIGILFALISFALLSH